MLLKIDTTPDGGELSGEQVCNGLPHPIHRGQLVGLVDAELNHHPEACTHAWPVNIPCAVDD